jgi:F0F1-type ATP synthase assembly protein I
MQIKKKYCFNLIIYFCHIKMNEKEPNNDLNKSYSAYSKVLSLLIQVIIFMVIFAFSGNWLDNYFVHKIPYLTILGVFLGMGLGFYNLIKNSLKDNK